MRAAGRQAAQLCLSQQYLVPTGLLHQPVGERIEGYTSFQITQPQIPCTHLSPRHHPLRGFSVDSYTLKRLLGAKLSTPLGLKLNPFLPSSQWQRYRETRQWSSSPPPVSVGCKDSGTLRQWLHPLHCIVPSIGVISAHQELHPLLLLSYHHIKFIPELNYSNSKPGFLWEPSRHLQSPAAWPFGLDHSPTSQYLHNLCARLQMQAPVTVCTILEGWR